MLYNLIRYGIENDEEDTFTQIEMSEENAKIIKWFIDFNGLNDTFEIEKLSSPIVLKEELSKF